MKNNYNFVMSILGGCFTLIFLVLGIIFHSISKDILGIIFSSIFYSVIILYFIFNSVYYKNENSAIFRLSNIAVSIFTTLILIYFILNYNGYSKWILLGLFILFLILEILLDSFDKLLEFKYLFSSIKLIIIIFLFISFYTNYILLLGIMCSLLFYISRLLGRLLKNNIILSFDIIALIIFGIFFLFI